MSQPRTRLVSSFRSPALLLAAGALAASACSGGSSKATNASAEGSTTPSSEVAPTISSIPDTTTTTAPPTPTTTPFVPDANPAPILLTTGSSGPEVQKVEQRLADLKFDVGAIDGKFDAATGQAVLSFQKQAGLPRTSKVDAATAARLSTAPLGNAMVADGAPTRIEVDIERQVLQYWKDGHLARVIGVSTGNNKRYCAPKKTGGGCGVAVTPTGRFSVERKIKGIRVSDLGELYDPLYFYKGFAVHGSPSVPAGPASHGCVRIPIRISKVFSTEVAIGTQVIVLKGGTPPLPDGGPPPVDPNAVTTTTTAPIVTTTTAAPAPATTTTTKAPASTTTTKAPAASTTTTTTKPLVP